MWSTLMSSADLVTAIEPFLESNKQWAKGFAESDGDLLKKFPTWQAPPILWFGCSDSRQPETTILGAKPGTCFTRYDDEGKNFCIKH